MKTQLAYFEFRPIEMLVLKTFNSFYILCSINFELRQRHFSIAAILNYHNSLVFRRNFTGQFWHISFLIGRADIVRLKTKTLRLLHLKTIIRKIKQREISYRSGIICFIGGRDCLIAISHANTNIRESNQLLKQNRQNDLVKLLGKKRSFSFPF